MTRALTVTERADLQVRRHDLSRALEPFDRERPGDLDRVAVAITDMFSSFSSMRYSESEGMAKIDSLMWSLQRQELPTWAIEEACRSVQDHGFPRSDGKRTWIERTWPPTDSELADAVRLIIKRRAWALANAQRVLTASVGR